MKKIAQIALVLGLATYLTSCIPARQFEELKSKNEQCDKDLAEQRKKYNEKSAELDETNNVLTLTKKEIEMLKLDSLYRGKTLRSIQADYENLNKTHNLLLDKNKELLSTNQNETTRLMGNYQDSQEKLQKKEDELRKLEKELDAKQDNLTLLQKDLTKSQSELEKKQARVVELESILAKKDSAVMALKAKVQEALLGFINKGLTVETRNGKVYVSLDEKLLFASGSTTVDPKGVDALKKLAKVLEQNAEINIMIEGHTDNIPYNSNGGAIKDNWDLSVLRSTSITKILLDNSKIEGRRITSAGRGEFVPVDKANTAEARKKNRRTEIILTPKLDELLKVLESN